MANSILTPSVIAKEALMQFKNGMGFSANVDKSYSKDFAKKGAKIGTSRRSVSPTASPSRTARPTALRT
jgi:hypothetical protein